MAICFFLVFLVTTVTATGMLMVVVESPRLDSIDSRNKFPFTLHSKGQYCKRIHGKMYCLSKDKEEALRPLSSLRAWRKDLTVERPRSIVLEIRDRDFLRKHDLEMT